MISGGPIAYLASSLSTKLCFMRLASAMRIAARCSSCSNSFSDKDCFRTSPLSLLSPPCSKYKIGYKYLTNTSQVQHTEDFCNCCARPNRSFSASTFASRSFFLAAMSLSLCAFIYSLRLRASSSATEFPCVSSA